MKKICLILTFFTLTTTGFSAIPDSTFFAGGKILDKEFTLEYEKANGTTTKNLYTASVLAFSVGFRGTFTRVFFDIIPSRSFSYDSSEIDYTAYSINAEGFKSLDLLFITGGIHADYVTLSKKSGSLPGGYVFGVNMAAGFFVGRFSGEFNLSYSFTQLEKDDIKYVSDLHRGFSAHYHI